MQKVGHGLLPINKEASMQLHYAYILQQVPGAAYKPAGLVGEEGQASAPVVKSVASAGRVGEAERNPPQYVEVGGFHFIPPTLRHLSMQAGRRET